MQRRGPVSLPGRFFWGDAMEIDLSEYDHPDLYDAENDTGTDLEFILNQARKTGGPVLDIACGNGRIGLPLAKVGYQVTGIDLSETMLMHGREKAGDLPMTFLKADCRDFSLDQRFSLAFMTGHGFQNLLGRQDRLALFQSVRQHLTEDGLFLFETRNELSSSLTQNCPREFYRSYHLPNGAEIRCDIEQSYDPETGILDYRIWRQDQLSDQVFEGSGRICFPTDEMVRSELDMAGFQLHECIGDWDGCPQGTEAPERIYLCGRK